MLVTAACGGESVNQGGKGEKESPPERQFLTIATASTGGTFYPIGVGMGQLWTEKLQDQGINATGQSSAGSTENIDLLRKGEAHLAILQGIYGPMAWEGTGPFEGNKYEGLRSISMLWPNVEHFVLKEDQIQTGTIEDIKGKTFSIGAKASGTEMSSLTVLGGIGLSTDDFSPEYLGYNETASAIKDGRMDGGAMPGGTPVSAVLDLYASNSGVKVLEVSDEQLENIKENSGAFYRFVIPAETYPGEDKDINTIAQPNWLGVSSELDEETVYMLTKSLFENLDFMYKVHDSAKYIKLETALDGLSVPLHIGAYKYFEEAGLEIPSELVPPEAK
jgi:TRAP transporter TAXI family solute receptor